MNEEVFKIEEVKERAKFIERCNELFKGKVLMTCSDCLTYVFDSMCEAVMFIIYRVKEVDYVGHFNQADIFNIGSPDIGIRITTDVESYIVKTLDSYKYEQEEEKLRKEQEELDFMLGDSDIRFLNNIHSKVALLKSELNCFDFDNDIDIKIQHMLNRYFGVNGWRKYWFTTRVLNRLFFEVTLNILLTDGGTIINVPSDKPQDRKIIKTLENKFLYIFDRK